MTTKKKTKLQAVPDHAEKVRDLQEAGLMQETATLLSTDPRLEPGVRLRPRRTSAEEARAEVEHRYPVELSGLYLLTTHQAHNSSFVGLGKHFRNGLGADGTVRSLRMSDAGVVRAEVERDGVVRTCLFGPGSWASAEVAK